MRRVYRQRADAMIFLMVSLVAIGTAAVWMQTSSERETSNAGQGSDGPPQTRLHIAPIGPTPDALMLDDAVLDDLPFLRTALNEARTTGHATLEDAGLVATIWARLGETHDVDGHDVAVTYAGDAYRLYDGY